MRLFRFNSLKTKNSVIFILVMIPLFAAFVSYEANQQAKALRKSLTERGVILAKTGAITTGKLFSTAIKDGKLTTKQVFDKDYKLIPGTNPQKYYTQYDSFTDENLREIEDSLLKDKVIVYAIAMDVSGYVPTHNTKFTKSGGGLAVDRSKRIFDDPVANAASSNQKPSLIQEYNKDTGETIWDISAPVYVDGKHWGAFRVGVSIAESSKQVAAVVKREIINGAIFMIALIALAIFISHRISNRVTVLVDEANKVASGDLTLSNLIIDSKDEVGSLGKSFTNMVIGLRNLTEKTQYSTRLIETYTRDLLHHSENVTNAADSASSKMGLVSEAMRKMEEGAGDILETSRKASEGLTIAEDSAQKFLANMVDSKEAMSIAHNVVKDLEFQVEKVGQFIQFVSILADQAGFMAEKIVQEAARYCSRNNDLADLASQVKGKADEAAKHTTEVTELFQTVRDHARQASETLEKHRSVILEGINVARISSKSLTTIVSEIKKMATLTNNTLDYSRQLVEGVSSVHDDIEAQTELLKKFTVAAGTLEQVVNELQATIKKIKV